MESTSYKRTQPGTSMLIAVVLLLALQAVFTFGKPLSVSVIIITAILLGVGLIFSTMTIGVSDQAVEWWFTFGVLHQSVPISDIEFVISDRVSLLNGLGIRTNGRDWLWIVSGQDVTSLELRNGKKISLGSPEAQNLALLIESIVSAQR